MPLNRHVKTLLKALMYMIVWFIYNDMSVVNVVRFYLVINSDATMNFFLEIIKLY